MAYDEGLAERVRDALREQAEVTEKKMFGGLAFMLLGKMCIGVVQDELMVRVGKDNHERLVSRPHARPMDFTGRPMSGFLFVDPDGIESDDDLEWWVNEGVAFVRSLAPK